MSYEQAIKGKPQKKTQHDDLYVKVLSQFKTYYDDYARNVSAENETGPFDILKGHANFISLLKPGEVTIRGLKGKEKKLTVERGIVRVNQDRVEVFLDV